MDPMAYFEVSKNQIFQGLSDFELNCFSISVKKQKIPSRI